MSVKRGGNTCLVALLSQRAFEEHPTANFTELSKSRWQVHPVLSSDSWYQGWQKL
jgi:hypothetical protein